MIKSAPRRHCKNAYMDVDGSSRREQAIQSSDVAIEKPPSLRGAKRRGNPVC